MENNNNNNIRPPDNTIKEILIDNNNFNNIFNNDFNNDFNHVFNNNYIRDDYELQIAINESIIEQENYEKKQLELLNKTKLRFQSFKNILFQLKKLSMFDKNMLNFCNIIEPIIDLYCSCSIDNYECDKNMYDIIFNTFKTIRITELDLELLKKIFIIENNI
jgi:hypothetical protein